MFQVKYGCYTTNAGTLCEHTAQSHQSQNAGIKQGIFQKQPHYTSPSFPLSAFAAFLGLLFISFVILPLNSRLKAHR